MSVELRQGDAQDRAAESRADERDDPEAAPDLLAETKSAAPGHGEAITSAATTRSSRAFSSTYVSW